MKKTTAFLLLLLLCTKIIIAQETDMINLVGPVTVKKEIVKNAFKSPRVIMGHSMEFLSKGTLDFRILHRFGSLDKGINNFYGLDQASMRIGLDYGITNNLMIGIGRSTLKKEIDSYLKLALIRQSTGKRRFPFTVAVAGGATVNTLPTGDPEKKYDIVNRMSYFGQLIIGRKFSEKLTLQLSPTIVHRNLVPLHTQPNDYYSLGVGGRYKLSKRLAFTFDYFYLFNGIIEDVNYHPLSVGFDIETGGHVFQLHFTNAMGMNERAFITETYNSWSARQISFGFNLSRVFQVVKNHNATL